MGQGQNAENIWYKTVLTKYFVGLAKHDQGHLGKPFKV
jgi:hypothetical protein